MSFFHSKKKDQKFSSEKLLSYKLSPTPTFPTGSRHPDSGPVKKLFDRREFFLTRIFGSFFSMKKEQGKICQRHIRMTTKKDSINKNLERYLLYSPHNPLKGNAARWKITPLRVGE